MIALYIILGILLLIIAVLFLPVRIYIDFAHNIQEDECFIVCKFLFIKLKILPRESEEEEKEIKKAESAEDSGDDKYKKIFEIVKKTYKDLWEVFCEIFAYLVNHAVKINELYISGVMGVGNPMYTGILSGAVHAFIYNLIGFISRRSKLSKHEVNIKTDFDNLRFDIGAHIKMTTRAFHFIVMLFMILKTYKNIRQKFKVDGNG